ncbi:MAG: hypothetical protein U0232_21675 [Thermomicrobiales bacterium]
MTWILPAALLLFGALPVAAGLVRLTQLFGGAAITPANARFFESPVPVVLHIVGAAVYALLGARSSSRPDSGGVGPVGTAWRSAAGPMRAAGRALSGCG